MFTLEDQFEQFWAAWPRKVKKPYAKSCFMRAMKKTTIAVLLADIEKRKQSRQWRDGFIENPSTYLNNEQWNDVIEEPNRNKVAGKVFTAPASGAVQQAIETRRRRAEMSAAGMSDDEIEAVFEAEYEARKR